MKINVLFLLALRVFCLFLQVQVKSRVLIGIRIKYWEGGTLVSILFYMNLCHAEHLGSPGRQKSRNKKSI